MDARGADTKAGASVVDTGATDEKAGAAAAEAGGGRGPLMWRPEPPKSFEPSLVVSEKGPRECKKHRRPADPINRVLAVQGSLEPAGDMGHRSPLAQVTVQFTTSFAAGTRK